MFALDDQRRNASDSARAQIQLFEKTLGLRISMQKVVDCANRLPTDNPKSGGVAESDIRRNGVADLQAILKSLVDVLETQLDDAKDTSDLKTDKKNRKRANNETVEWDRLFEIQTKLKRNWQQVTNRWHARLQFGSEEQKSKMKVFKQSIWDQIDLALEDDKRVIDKSRMPWAESTRLLKEHHEDEIVGNSPSSGDKSYDEEVYDDRQFYSMLLKTFITQASIGIDGIGAMRATDMEASRNYKKSRQNVDRKASKGRKIRYKVHSKLQNFMFPVPCAAPDMDVDKLFQSLFQ